MIQILRHITVSSIVIFFSMVLLTLLGSVPISAYHTSASIPAFPDAEGFGSNAKGGRGGTVYVIDTLSDDTTQGVTFRDCAQATGARICVFKVGGTIELNSTVVISKPFITIAGQTAPGGGITIKMKNPALNQNSIEIQTEEVIIRYIRSRPGTKSAGARALSINKGGMKEEMCNLTTYVCTAEQKFAREHAGAYNVVVDHNSFSWTGDEMTIAWYDTNHVTFSWNVHSESIYPAWKGPSMGKGEIGGHYSFHHNLVAHHGFRLPVVAGGGGPTDVVNNVIYNFKNKGSITKLGAMINIVNNYIEAGPDTQTGAYYVDHQINDPDPDRPTKPVPNDYADRGYHVSGNILQDSYLGAKKINGILPSNVDSVQIHSTRYATPQLTTLTAQDAYNQVLDKAGAYQGLDCNGDWVSRRDAVDTRIANSVRNDWSSNYPDPKIVGYISDPSEVGGWPALAAGTACLDSDNDGMPNVWESVRGLNINANDSALDRNNDGYTNIEEYINGPALGGPQPTVGPTSTPTRTPTPGAVSPTRTPTPVPPTATRTPTVALYPGDANGDGLVDLADLSAVLSNFGKSPMTRAQGNVAGNDTVVNLVDLSTVLSNFATGVINDSCPPLCPPSATPTPSSASIVTNLSPLNYVLVPDLQVGSTQYLDLTHTFQTLPTFLLGSYYIQTANSDKASTASSFITFTSNVDTSVYVAYDSRNVTVPTWLTNSFVLQPDTLKAGGVTFNIYKINYSQGGSVTLGGNSVNDNRMYSVMIEAR